MWLRTVNLLDANPGWMNPEASVIVQIDPTEREPLSLKHLVEEDERRYGNTLLLFMRHPMTKEPETPEE
ncbi:MAG: hypothetical protein HC828_06415 [Blastochloris sp.]|nr:hypothetical protein [Blastochloris sp.]